MNLTCINSGYELFKILKQNYCIGDENSWWWPSPYSLEIKNYTEIKGAKCNYPLISVVIESILGQNTRYENVLRARDNLIQKRILSVSKDILQDNEKTLNNILSVSENSVENLIRGTGFFRQKAKRIISLMHNIKSDFLDFNNFSKNVSKEWLLKQSGIGQESASSILNYALKREEIVVDKYTYKLIKYIGFDIQEYESLQEFLLKDMENAYKEYDFNIGNAQIYARFHGKIINFLKENKQKLIEKS